MKLTDKRITMNKKKEHEELFDPMEIMKNINCMFFGACDRKQLELEERKD